MAQQKRLCQSPTAAAPAEQHQPTPPTACAGKCAGGRAGETELPLQPHSAAATHLCMCCLKSPFPTKGFVMMYSSTSSCGCTDVRRMRVASAVEERSKRGPKRTRGGAKLSLISCSGPQCTVGLQAPTPPSCQPHLRGELCEVCLQQHVPALARLPLEGAQQPAVRRAGSRGRMDVFSTAPNSETRSVLHYRYHVSGHEAT